MRPSARYTIGLSIQSNLKVTLISSASEVTTGGGRHVAQLVCGLHNALENIHVVCLESGSLSEVLKTEGVAVDCLSVGNSLDLASAMEIRDILRTRKSAIVHTHGERAMFLGNWCAVSQRIPNIITTVHRSIRRTTSWSRTRRLFYGLIEDMTLKRATTQIIAVSNAMRRELETLRRIPSWRIKVIEHGIEEISREEVVKCRERGMIIRHKLGIPAKSAVIGSVGRLVKEKGYRYLVEAARLVLGEFPQVFFVLVGDGEQKAKLESAAVDYGIGQNIHFAGRQAQVNDWLGMFDLFVLPSPWESFGLAIAEAMRFDLPVVASDLSAPSEIIDNGRSGLLVMPGNAALISKAILTLLKNPDFAKAIGRAGNTVVRKRLSLDRMIRETASLYHLKKRN